MQQMRYSMSTGLFAVPSFLRGAARVLDLGGTFDVYNESDAADILALHSDWKQVGSDIMNAMEDYDRVEKIAK